VQTPSTSPYYPFGWLRGLAFAAAALSGCCAAHAQTPADAAPLAELRFQDFFTLPVGKQGLEMGPALRQADGKKVAITGYMVQQESSLPGQFMLTPRPVQMSEHADGDADDLPPAVLLVKLDASQSDWVVPHARGLIQVRGVLRVGREEGRDGRVSWVQMQLDPDATRGMNAFELAGYMHSLQHRH
jgi:hypothetical protein